MSVEKAEVTDVQPKMQNLSLQEPHFGKKSNANQNMQRKKRRGDNGKI